MGLGYGSAAWCMARAHKPWFIQALSVGSPPCFARRQLLQRRRAVGWAAAAAAATVAYVTAAVGRGILQPRRSSEQRHIGGTPTDGEPPVQCVAHRWPKKRDHPGTRGRWPTHLVWR